MSERHDLRELEIIAERPGRYKGLWHITEAESILSATAKALANPQAAGLSAEERAGIGASVAALKESVPGKDYKLIRKRIDELNRTTERLAELLMNSAVSTALEGRKLAEV